MGLLDMTLETDLSHTCRCRHGLMKELPLLKAVSAKHTSESPVIKQINNDLAYFSIYDFEMQVQ
jgi:hypothetical protein